jgi:hypothetical protein
MFEQQLHMPDKLIPLIWYSLLQSLLYVFDVFEMNKCMSTSFMQTVDTTKERIRKLFNNVELSISLYDTARVAMVPSPKSPKSFFSLSISTG